MSSPSTETIQGDTDLHQDRSLHSTAEPRAFPKRYDPTRRSHSTIAVDGSAEPRDAWSFRGDARTQFIFDAMHTPGRLGILPRSSRMSDESNTDDVPQSSIYQYSAARQRSSPLLERRPEIDAQKNKTVRQWLNKSIDLHQEWSYVRQLPLVQGDNTLEDLLQKLSAIEEGFAFIPKAFEAGMPSSPTEIESAITETILDSNLYDDPRPQSELHYEWSDLARAVRQTKILEKSRSHAVSWGERVWTRILDHAIDVIPKSSISWHNTTTAAITRDFKPSQHPYNKPQGPLLIGISRTIDYALAMIPKQNAAAVIDDILSECDIAGLPVTMNPVEYNELIKCPVAIAITTGGTDDSKTQDRVKRLATWASAWHKRMERLALDDMIDPKLKKSPVFLPLIEITGRHWWLYFAIEDVDAGRICISRTPSPLGCTSTLNKTYKLVASLRVLMRWADGPYRLWWDEILGVSTLS